MTLPIAFPSITPRLSLPLLYVGQTQKKSRSTKAF